jgi:methylornithine synthase
MGPSGIVQDVHQMKKPKWRHVEIALARARQGGKLPRREITLLLTLREEDQIEAVFKAARDLRRAYFGERVFLYGFLYFSTYCRNDCSFCSFRHSNKECRRYRKEEPEILEAACQLAASGVHLIDLTMGEDPEYFCNGRSGFDKLVRLVESVGKATGLPAMISPGVVPDDVLGELARVGATWYACYQETHRRALFNQLRPGQSYEARLKKKILARKLGLLIEEGLLTGAGESIDDVAHSIHVMGVLNADQVRVMSFIPQRGTPMEGWASPDRLRELLTIAVMRLVFPERLIPASLDVDGLSGLKLRLDAGANVVTSLVPPDCGLAGVSQHSLDIKNSRRTAAAVLPVLRESGLKVGDSADYNAWIEGRRRGSRGKTYGEQVAC